MLLGIAAGTLIGVWLPDLGRALGPLGIAFVKAMRMMVPPVLFCTIVEGIVRHGATRDTGATVLRSILIFLAITLAALGLGLGAALVLHPGEGLVLAPDTAMLDLVAQQVRARAIAGPGDFLLHIVPDTLFSAFTAGDVLPVLFVAALVGFGLLRIGEAGAPIVRGIEALTRLQFAIFGFLIRAAPVGAFGAIAFTVGTYGVGFIGSLGMLVATLALACGLLVAGLLLAVRLATGIGPGGLWRLFRDEILIVLGTSSTEVVLPRLIEKLEAMGCPRGIVGLTVPLGYSLNLAGTAVYLIVATLFLAEAVDVTLSPQRILAYLAVMLVTSKAAAGVTGSGFSALLLTLSLLPDVPVGAAALLIAIDRFLSEIRALTSGTANVAASLLVTRWSGVRPALPPPRRGE
ncbi:cation:dicarboxylate symporter family transporter [Sphingomonas lacusdianchii]|uniref:cation:dicarboxylate symporter family transporter n=1 Tax=Sphingomonas lacusdianchii TaxID=2917992 RepID=UPI001F5734FE|nr:cation:dicarboxylase symporter family transporter [Sphingomonas sp. JXJ CY 53]